ncbi:MAG TPA: hypothetical protein VIH47_06410 [Solirubrobacterales bacterium]
MNELQNRLSSTAKVAADQSGLVPDVSAMDYLGALVNQAAETLGPDGSETDIARAEDSFQRLAQEVAAELGPTAPAGVGVGEGAGEALAAEPIKVTGPQIEALLGRLCPGFFPWC